MVALDSVVRSSRGTVVCFHVSALGSISEVSTASLYFIRVASVSMHVLIRTFALEYEPYGTVVVGIHPGLWFYGMERQVSGVVLAPGDVARRIGLVALKVNQKQHSGRVLRHTMEEVKP